MRFTQPFVCEIAPDTYAINEYGIAAEFLVIGSERALLIDTGVGLCDLPGLIRRFTSLPYDVVLTHGHGDHAGGIGHFSNIYLHPADFEMVEKIDLEGVKNYNRMLGKQGAWEVYDYDPDAICPIKKMPVLHPIREGYVFDLGGRKLTVIETPGHTAGSICLLDEKARILFSGDACNINLGIFDSPIEEALTGLNKLADIRDKFDRNYNGHIGYIKNPDCLAMPPHVLDDCIEICKSILDGTAQPEILEWFGGKKACAVVKNGTRISSPG